MVVVFIEGNSEGPVLGAFDGTVDVGHALGIVDGERLGYAVGVTLGMEIDGDADGIRVGVLVGGFEKHDSQNKSVGALQKDSMGTFEFTSHRKGELPACKQAPLPRHGIGIILKKLWEGR